MGWLRVPGFVLNVKLLLHTNKVKAKNLHGWADRKKKCMDGQRKKYTWMAGWKYMYRKIVTNVLLFTVFFIFILGYANI